MPPVNRRRRQPKTTLPNLSTWPEAARKEHLKQQLLATPLAEMELPVRVVNVLEEHGVILVQDLVRQSYETLMSMTNFGGKTLKTVVEALRKLGVKPPKWKEAAPEKKSRQPLVAKLSFDPW